MFLSVLVGRILNAQQERRWYMRLVSAGGVRARADDLIHSPGPSPNPSVMGIA